ncbi:dienoyl-CoA isomerase [Zopfochytrium polystomum]|nr:dienoyl-CoA isomerase [Zopfochytrium polystomum]
MQQGTPTPLGSFEAIRLTFLPAPAHTLHVELNRPQKLNAIDRAVARELRQCFVNLAASTLPSAFSSDRPSEASPVWDVRAVVVSGGDSKAFSTGLDLVELVDGIGWDGDPARGALRYLRNVEELQETFTAIERCPQPVIAAVHGLCFGAAVELIAACDIRVCAADAAFAVREVDVGLAATLGLLQRLPAVVASQSWLRDVALSARTFGAAEAAAVGLVSRVAEAPPPVPVPADGGGGGGGRSAKAAAAKAAKAAAVAAALRVAAEIASKSPVAVAGTKRALLYARDHSVAEGLAQVRLWNAAMIRTEDLAVAVQASLDKKTMPKFSRL